MTPAELDRLAKLAGIPIPTTEEISVTDDRLPRYAVIHVKPTPTSDAWPIVERTYGGGWQSGAHHYPDADVLDVRPLALVEQADPAPATDTATARAARILGDLADALDAVEWTADMITVRHLADDLACEPDGVPTSVAAVLLAAARRETTPPPGGDALATLRQLLDGPR